MKQILILLAAFMTLTAQAQRKHEFRGAWIQCVNGQFQGIGTARMQETLTQQLNELQKDGVNAIIFQVRPECDALYASQIEPWSRFLTGRQGQAPDPYWDPLEWMVNECHKRGMELHAWINPYRAKTKGTTELATTHIAVRQPQCCFNYDGLTILNPGLPENRDYICRVVSDIVTRYDIDGLHIDDYFYPYPVAGLSIPDDVAYNQHHNGIKDRGDWRRYNVNRFIEELYQTVHHIKPWVKVGISPFGIYRNRRSSNIGSDTNGLQNYDDLYADVLFWVNNGWVDYLAPQIYWEIGNKAADYETLIHWWNKYASKRPLYIGEDVERTVKYADPNNPGTHQQGAKMQMHMQLPGVQGTVLWYAKAVVDNPASYETMLRDVYWRYPALQPRFPYIDRKAPKKPRKIKPVWTRNGYILFWTAPKGDSWKNKAHLYGVYRFTAKEKINLNNPAKLVAVTPNEYYHLPYEQGAVSYVYVVTAIDRMSNESKGVKQKVKL